MLLNMPLDAPECRLSTADRELVAAVRSARVIGIERAALSQLRSLIAERGRNSWRVGDVLVQLFGPPGPPVVHDRSTRRLEALAEELGCSASWLIACRAAAAAFPERDRRMTVAFSVHRALAAREDRLKLLEDFVEHCRLGKVVPSLKLLTSWLDARDARGAPRPAVGRPRQDQWVRVERMALALETQALEVLVSKLTDALHSRQEPVSVSAAALVTVQLQHHLAPVRR
jgi:hypothetical protein